MIKKYNNVPLSPVVFSIEKVWWFKNMVINMIHKVIFKVFLNLYHDKKVWFKINGISSDI